MGTLRTGPRILLFDLSQHVHLPSYLYELIEFWSDHDLAGSLTILVWHTFLRDHTDVVELAARAPGRNIRFATLTAAERQRKLQLEASADGTTIAFHDLVRAGVEAPYAAIFDWQLLGRYAVQLGASQSFVIHLDHYLPLLAAGLELPTPLSGIYFGPTFHYADFAADGPASPERFRLRLREKFVLARSLHHPRLRTLFFFDRFAAEHAARLPDGARTAFLPDPVKLDPVPPERVAALRRELGIQPDRKVLLLFGHLARRKGAEALLEAVQQLPPATGRQICLLLIGETNPAYQSQVDRSIATLRSTCPVQVITRYAFVPRPDLPAYFQLADLVLAPYPRHAGMSGILLLAAAAGKPVLSSEWGLMGELTRRYRLGLTVDATRSEALAGALQRCIQEDPTTWCDPEQQRKLTEEHRSDRFAATLFQQLGCAVEAF